MGNAISSGESSVKNNKEQLNLENNIRMLFKNGQDTSSIVSKDNFTEDYNNFINKQLGGQISVNNRFEKYKDLNNIDLKLSENNSELDRIKNFLEENQFGGDSEILVSDIDFSESSNKLPEKIESENLESNESLNNNDIFLKSENKYNINGGSASETSSNLNSKEINLSDLSKTSSKQQTENISVNNILSETSINNNNEINNIEVSETSYSDSNNNLEGGNLNVTSSDNNNLEGGNFSVTSSNNNNLEGGNFSVTSSDNNNNLEGGNLNSSSSDDLEGGNFSINNQNNKSINNVNSDTSDIVVNENIAYSLTSNDDQLEGGNYENKDISILDLNTTSELLNDININNLSETSIVSNYDDNLIKNLVNSENKIEDLSLPVNNEVQKININENLINDVPVVKYIDIFEDDNKTSEVDTLGFRDSVSEVETELAEMQEGGKLDVKSPTESATSTDNNKSDVNILPFYTEDSVTNLHFRNKNNLSVFN